MITWAAFERDAIRRHGYGEFVRRAWHVLEPRPMVWSGACEQLAIHFEAQWNGTIRELVVNVPPGSSKSTFATVMLAPWVWTIDPTVRFIHASYNQQLSMFLAGKCMRLLVSDWYRERWGDLLETGDPAIGDFKTRVGGVRLATSIGGQGPGRHCDWFGVDDPIKPVTADGKPIATGEIERANRWLRNTMASRADDPRTFRKTITMQRVHEADPSQQCIDDGWMHLLLPARFEVERKCVTPVGGDWRTTEGELLDPVRRPAAVLDAECRALGAHVAAAQYQQRPAPIGGITFKTETFQRFELRDMPFAKCFTVLSVDCAFKGQADSDCVALEVWGQNGPGFYLYYSNATQRGFWATLQAIRDVLVEWPCDAILIEDKANGSAVIETLRLELSNVLEFNPDREGDKNARAKAASIPYESGNVYHLNASWTAAKEHNLAVFPYGRIKDDTDATSQAIIWLRNRGGQHFAAITAEQWRALGSGVARMVG